MSHKLTPRQVIARSYPTWDYAMADRLIAWLADCGYEIIKKDGVEEHQILRPSTLDGQVSPVLAQAC
jgi:hypothetical protein